MAPLQYCFLGESNLARELRARLSLQHATQDQHDMHRGQVAGSEHSPTIQIIDALTALTAPDGQATPTLDAKEARRVVARLAVRARQPSGMKVLHQPGRALLIIEK